MTPVLTKNNHDYVFSITEPYIPVYFWGMLKKKKEEAGKITSAERIIRFTL